MGDKVAVKGTDGREQLAELVKIAGGSIDLVGDGAPAGVGTLNLLVKFTAPTQIARIALGGNKKLSFQVEPLAAPGVAARFRFGHPNTAADRALDAPLRSDLANPVTFAVPDGMSYAVLVPAASQTPSLAAPIVVNVLLES